MMPALPSECMVLALTFMRVWGGHRCQYTWILTLGQADQSSFGGIPRRLEWYCAWLRIRVGFVTVLESTFGPSGSPQTGIQLLVPSPCHSRAASIWPCILREMIIIYFPGREVEVGIDEGRKRGRAVYIQSETEEHKMITCSVQLQILCMCADL